MMTMRRMTTTTTMTTRINKTHGVCWFRTSGVATALGLSRGTFAGYPVFP